MCTTHYYLSPPLSATIVGVAGLACSGGTAARAAATAGMEALPAAAVASALYHAEAHGDPPAAPEALECGGAT